MNKEKITDYLAMAVAIEILLAIVIMFLAELIIAVFYRGDWTVNAVAITAIIVKVLMIQGIRGKL